MIKRLIRHEEFGEGRVVAQENTTLKIRFIGASGPGAEQVFSRDALNSGFLTPVLLERGRRCVGPDGACAVLKVVTNGAGNTRSYEVLYGTGVSSICTEADLEPFTSESLPSPGLRLAAREIGHLVQFRSREAFRGASIQNLRQAGHLTALLSARIQLHPHQAFVAGTVLDDRRRRYILADEVGLGKTIEAGIVIHDILAASPTSRILIISPGTLTQQWFCEIYSKFSGRIFTLLDLHAESSIRWDDIGHVIVSMSQVLQFAAKPLLARRWDLVVIDECHHLLARPVLYSFAAELSRRCQSLLLLSAVPAQQREEEYFRLLALLEPEKFDSESPESRASFKELFEAQGPLSRRLQPLIIRMRGLDSGDYTKDDVVRQARKLLDLPMLAQDSKLAAAFQSLEVATSGHSALAQQIVDGVADRYRVYRRILRNRRKSLQQEQKIEVVTRRRDLRPYRTGDLERSAQNSVNELLHRASQSSRDRELLSILGRNLWQSLASSDSAFEFLAPITSIEPGMPNKQGLDFLALGHLIGYEDWPEYLELLQRSAASIFDSHDLGTAVRSVALWKDSGEQAARYEHLKAVLRECWREKKNAKVLVFAGYPGIAEEVEVALTSQLGESVVAPFRADLTREQKGSAALRFRSDPATLVLISDESGGEGRNFEFADVVVHYDTPWQASRIEQRIGRLDRIGRSKYSDSVRSIVLCAEDSTEHALIRCFDNGLNVYRESISGLEFSLRDEEAQLADVALIGGVEALGTAVPCLREVAQTERARDEYDALLDWASFSEDRGQRYLSVRPRPELERTLEASFIEYFQNMSRTRAVDSFRDERSPEGLWRFDLDSVRSGVLRTEATGKIVGTFRRDLAQSRLDREFLQIGNPLFDAIVGAVEHHSAYRTFAVQCKAPGRPAWCGFEFVFSCRPRLDSLSARPDLVTLAKSYLPANVLHVFLAVNGDEGDHEGLRTIRQSLTRQNKGRFWVNLWKDRLAAIDQIVPESTWVTVIPELEDKARRIAEDRFRSRVAGLDDLIQRWLNLACKYRAKGTPVSQEEAISLEILSTSVREWQVHEEGAGFLAVNHELVRYA